MSSLAVATMIVICGLVWGGLLTLVAFAVRSEGRKGGEDAEEGAD